MTIQVKVTKMNEPIKTQVTDNGEVQPVPEDVKQMQDEYKKLVGELVGTSGQEESQQQPQPACAQPSDTLRAKVEDLPK